MFLRLKFDVNEFSMMGICRFSAVTKQTWFNHLDICLDDFSPWYANDSNSTKIATNSVHSVDTVVLFKKTKRREKPAKEGVDEKKKSRTSFRVEGKKGVGQFVYLARSGAREA